MRVSIFQSLPLTDTLNKLITPHQVEDVCPTNTEMIPTCITLLDKYYSLCLQVREAVDQGGEDQREADGGSAHWNPVGVRHLHCFRQRPTDFL